MASPNNMDKKIPCPVPVGVRSKNSLQLGAVMVSVSPWWRRVARTGSEGTRSAPAGRARCSVLPQPRSAGGRAAGSVSRCGAVPLEQPLCVSAARSPGTPAQGQRAGERGRLCFAFPCEGFFGCVLCPFKSLGSLGEPERIAFSVII